MTKSNKTKTKRVWLFLIGILSIWIWWPINVAAIALPKALHAIVFYLPILVFIGFLGYINLKVFEEQPNVKMNKALFVITRTILGFLSFLVLGIGSVVIVHFTLDLPT